MINFGAIEKLGLRYEEEWIVVETFETKTDKEGKPYSLPVFQLKGSFTQQDIDLTDQAIDIVKHYFNSKAPVHMVAPNGQPATKSAVTMPSPTGGYSTFDEIPDDDLPF
jgi:hypothetical protein